MYNNIPKSCEFGGCKLFEDCSLEYKTKAHGLNYMSPPLDLTKCVKPCDKCQECFTYMDKYNGSLACWEDMHGYEYDERDDI